MGEPVHRSVKPTDFNFRHIFYDIICQFKPLGDVFLAAIQYDGTNKYLRITDIDENTRMFSQEDLTSPGTDLSCCNDYLLEDGDITIARTGASVGKSYIYHLSDGKVYFAGFLIRTRLNDNVDKDCVFYSTLTDKYAKYIRLVSQRSGQPGVNIEELNPNRSLEIFAIKM